MAFTANRLMDRLSAMAADTAPSRVLVAFSGGMDSTVLLHALEQAVVPLTAVRASC